VQHGMLYPSLKNTSSLLNLKKCGIKKNNVLNFIYTGVSSAVVGSGQRSVIFGFSSAIQWLKN
jgi:dynactin complex subunit